jgi:hypothetical protein
VRPFAGDGESIVHIVGGSEQPGECGGCGSIFREEAVPLLQDSDRLLRLAGLL